MLFSLQNALSRYVPTLLAADGIAVVESSAKDEPELPPLAKRTSRRYGSARLTVFEHP
jgi:hypothetical protein